MKTRDVTQFLRDLVDITLVYTTDEEGYVISSKTGDKILLSDDGRKSPIILYQEEIKDNEAHVLNPLAEGLGQTRSSLWFFNVLKVSLLGRIESLCQVIVSHTAAEKKRTGKELDKDTDHFPMELLNIAGHIVEDVDEKTIDELRQVLSDKDGNEFLSIYYQKKNLRHVVRSGLFDSEEEGAVVPSFKSKYPKVRKKTWGVFERLLFDILNIKHKEELSKFDRKADTTSDGRLVPCVRFSSLLNVIFAIYQEINPLLGLINEKELSIDLSVLADHISKIAAYAGNAMFMVMPQKTAMAAPVVPMAPVPVMSQNFFSPSPPGQIPGPGFSGVPGPELAVGRRAGSPPIYGAPPQQSSGFFQPAGAFPTPQPGFGSPWQPAFTPTPPFNPPFQQAPAFGQQPVMGGFSNVPNMPPGIWR